MTNDTPNPSVIQIPLTRGYTAIVSLQDADLARFKWSTRINGKYTAYAAHLRKDPTHPRGQSLLLLHRVILERVLNRKLVKGEIVDHINGDGLDNRRENLRLATYNQNTLNSKIQSRNTSGYRGVSWRKCANKWIAKIVVNGKNLYLGLFTDKHQAAVAYNKAALEHYGEFARLNEIPE
jgi:hypothetical protein